MSKVPEAWPSLVTSDDHSTKKQTAAEKTKAIPASADFWLVQREPKKKLKKLGVWTYEKYSFTPFDNVFDATRRQIVKAGLPSDLIRIVLKGQARPSASGRRGNLYHYLHVEGNTEVTADEMDKAAAILLKAMLKNFPAVSPKPEGGNYFIVAKHWQYRKL